MLLLISFLVSRYFQQNDSEAVKAFKSNEPNNPQVIKAFGKLPMRFEMNQGQTHDAVRFLSRGKGFTLFLTENEAVLTFRGASSGKQAYSDKHRGNPVASGLVIATVEKPEPATVLRMQLIGAQADPEIQGLDELATKSNYFIGNNPERWQTGAPSYAKVKYADVYPGIDLVYYGWGAQLEYDFVVAPGAELSAITLGFKGANELNVDENGDLVIDADGGEVTLRAPVIYQELDGGKQYISGRYALANADQVQFDIDPYDESRQLVIDPVLMYATFLGGIGRDEGEDIGLDAAGNIYILGITNSPDFPTVNPIQASPNNTNPGETDLFVSKLNPTGSTLLYSTYLGGSEREIARGLAVDAAGNAYFTGFTYSDDYPTVNAFQGSRLSSTTAFVTKLSPDGSTLAYSTFLGGTGGKFAGGIAVDAGGHTYVTGVTHSKDFPLVNPFQGTQDTTFSTLDAYVSKFLPDGSGLVYSTYLGGSDFEWDQTIAVDQAGQAYVMGRTKSDDFPTANALQSSNNGNNDLFITKFNASGSGVVYSTYLGGSEVEHSGEIGFDFSIAADQDGNAYITGKTSSADFPLVNAYQEDLISFFGEPFVSKISADGSKLIYSTYLAGSKEEESRGIAADAEGNTYITGFTESTDFPVVDPLQGSLNGIERDLFITKLSPDGSNVLFSTYYGGIGRDEANGIFVDNLGTAYITGYTLSPDFPTLDPLQGYLAGGDDAFIIKVSTGGQKPLCSEGTVWQVVKFAGQFNTNKEQNKVTFIRIVEGDTIKVEAEIVEVTEDTISVRVPEGLIGEIDKNNNVLTRANVLKPPDPSGGTELIWIEITVERPGQNPITTVYDFCFIFPYHLIYDQVEIGNPPVFTPPPPGFSQQILPQFLLDSLWAVQTFVFLGKSTDGTAGLRVMNTRPFPSPLRLEAFVIGPGGVIMPDPPINVGIGNYGFQFPVSQDGLYLIIVRHKPGLIFEAGPFQIHLSGDVGVPRKIIETHDTTYVEHPRGTRLDILFNHPAPRQQILRGENRTIAQTALFKFANPTTINQFAVAVLIPPPPLGFISGVDAIVRAPDPPDTLGFLSVDPLGNSIIDITTPTARTPAGRTFNVDPLFIGTVTDFTQVPIPASVDEDPVFLGGTVCAVIGRNDNVTLTLPNLGVTNLIFDMGSGQEIVDGNGNDFRVFATAGTYAVAVSNTPFSADFRPISDSAEEEMDFDIVSTGLSSARYVRIIAVPSVTIDAVQALNVFVDAMRDNVPYSDMDVTTITMRRTKAPETLFDPWLELISPNGSLVERRRSGFGDLTSAIRSDVALINKELTQIGYYRFLGRGFDLTPDEQAFGSFLVRLESGGDYDPVDIIVSNEDEISTVAQREGTITSRRQRDSYVFQMSPGQPLNIVVNGTGDTPLPNPVLELYDPEDFLIAANDDHPGRDRNSVISINQLPTNSFFTGVILPELNTYRIVVSAIDEAGQTSPLSEGTAHTRTVAGGEYELKVFTGDLIGGPINPAVSSITPNGAFQGAVNLEVTINGAHFAGGAAVTFSGTGITVKNVSFITTEELRATIDIAENAPPGQRDVTVMNPDGQGGTAAGLFEVRTSQEAVVLNWVAPAAGQTLAPPSDLTAQPGGSQTMAKQSTILVAEEPEASSLSGKRSKYLNRKNRNPKPSKSRRPVIKLQNNQQADELSNGAPVTRTIAVDEVQEFFINAPTDPEGATALKFKTSNSSGDPDLFVRFGSPPDIDNGLFDFSSENIAPQEEVIVVTSTSAPPLQAGDWFVTVLGFEQSTYTLTATFTQPEELANGAQVTRTVAFDEIQEFFINVPADATTIVIETSNSTGDPDLFVRFGSLPDIDNGLFDFSSKNFSPDEELITVTQTTNPPIQAGNWFVTIFGFEQSTYTLTATHDGMGGMQLLSYNIYRSTTPNARNTGAVVGNVAGNTTAFSDVVPNLGTFFYQVTAVYDQGESEPCIEAMVLVTGVEEGQPASLPVEFALGQNYPNPFNPTTRIRFDVPANSHLNI
jgi:hypothetical protein